MFIKDDLDSEDEPKMVFVLTETEKILIIALAAFFFLLSVLFTICFVSPFCALNKWFTKVTTKVNKAKLNGKKIFKPESKLFRLSIAPHYGTSADNLNGVVDTKETLSSQLVQPPTKSTTFPSAVSPLTVTTTSKVTSECSKHKKSLSKYKSSYSTLNDSDSKCIQLPTKIQFGIEWLLIDESSVRLHIHIVNVTNVPLRGYGGDPSCFVIVDLVSIGGLRNKRKGTSSLLTKAAISFKTSIAKRGTNPFFNETFTTAELPKSVLKEGRLKIKLIDDERYANQYCVGELNVPLKKYLQAGEKNEIIETFNFNTPKESKGEILFAICYLPTSKRVTINVMKATLTGQIPGSNLNYYVRILMFVNGKLIKKKKTASNTKLIWSEQEMITFDLSNSLPNNQITFMLALSSSKEPIVNVTSSPSSPEEQPDSGHLTSDSKRLRHIAHCVIGDQIWSEMKEEPRKQLTLWLKLM